MNNRLVVQSQRWVVAILLTLALNIVSAGGVDPETLTLRVNDATAPPGGLVAVVLRTYAARPIRQGQICMVVRLFRQHNHSANKSVAGSLYAPVDLRAPATGPFESMESAVVFSNAGDALQQVQFMGTDVGQPTMLEFASISATINASDGPLLVLYYRLRSDVQPGETYELSIDMANTMVTDANDEPVLLEARNGQLTIRAETDPIIISAAAEEPDLFNTVILGMQTEEAIAISSGQVGLRYSQDLLPGTPKVSIDPRYGIADWSLINIRGLTVVQFNSADHTLNTVPGEIVNLYLRLNPDALPGADRNVWLDPAYTFLYDSDGNALNLILEGDQIP